MRQYKHKDMVSARIGFNVALGLGIIIAFADVVFIFWGASQPNGLMPCLGVSALLWGIGIYGIFRAFDSFNPFEEMGINFTQPVEQKWAAACRALGLEVVHEAKKQVPMLRHIEGNSDRWCAKVALWPNQSIEQLRRVTDDMQKILGAASVEFDYIEGGHVVVTVARHLVPVADIVESVPEPEPVPVTGVAALSVIDVGTTFGHVKRTLPVLYSHILLVGISGAGKSSWIWSLIFGLAGGVKDGLVSLWGVDPKGLELAIGSAWWDRYASDEVAMVELLEDAVSEIKRRGGLMAGKARKVVPTEAMPLIVIFVDELADIMAIPDKKLRERAANAITRILRQGRALAVTLVGASQTPNKDTLSMRDDFPVRICLAVASSQVDMVLGQGAKEAGARPDRLQVPQDAGSAYVWVALTGTYELVRSHWIEDEVIIRTGQIVRMGAQEVRVTEQLNVPVMLPAPELN